jgi:hypothetical protein
MEIGMTGMGGIPSVSCLPARQELGQQRDQHGDADQIRQDMDECGAVGLDPAMMVLASGPTTKLMPSPSTNNGAASSHGWPGETWDSVRIRPACSGDSRNPSWQ